MLSDYNVDMSEELPKIFKEGGDPQVTQIKMTALSESSKRGCQRSWMELVTYKLHELWFVFARRPLRFSLPEFHALIGFECNTHISVKELEDLKYDGGFWSNVLRRNDGTITLFNLWTKDKEAVKKWRNADRIHLIYLAIILCVVSARDEKANIPLKYITVVMDLEKFRKYPWGVAAYDLLCKSVAKNRVKLKDKTTSYVLDGFSYSLQIWAMEVVPKIGKLCGKKLDKGFKNVQDQAFRRADDAEDYRIKWFLYLLMDESAVNDEASVNVEAAESDEDFQTPKRSKNLGARSKKGKKRLLDRGMKKKKQKVLSSEPKQAPFNEDMKAFVTQLLKDSRKEASVEVELGEPSPTKPSTSQTPLRRSKRGSPFDVKFSQADDMGRGIGTQGVEGLSQASYVPDCDPSQTKKEDDWWTPMTSVRCSKEKPLKKENTAPPPS
ncbi:hypothetical protein DY000_02053163, partial [Brassica cretica]